MAEVRDLLVLLRNVAEWRSPGEVVRALRDAFYDAYIKDGKEESKEDDRRGEGVGQEGVVRDCQGGTGDMGGGAHSKCPRDLGCCQGGGAVLGHAGLTFGAKLPC